MWLTYSCIRERWHVNNWVWTGTCTLDFLLYSHSNASRLYSLLSTATKTVLDGFCETSAIFKESLICYESTITATPRTRCLPRQRTMWAWEKTGTKSRNGQCEAEKILEPSHATTLAGNLIAVDNNSTLPFILDIFHITMKYLESALADGSYVCTCKNWSGGDRSVV